MADGGQLACISSISAIRCLRSTHQLAKSETSPSGRMQGISPLRARRLASLSTSSLNSSPFLDSLNRSITALMYSSMFPPETDNVPLPAAPQVSGAAVILLAYAKSRGVAIGTDPNVPAAIRTAIEGSATRFVSASDAAKLPGGVLNVAAAVKALDVAGLLNSQKQGAAAKASVGVTIAVFIVGALAGTAVTALAVVLRLKFRMPSPVELSQEGQL